MDLLLLFAGGVTGACGNGSGCHLGGDSVLLVLRPVGRHLCDGSRKLEVEGMESDVERNPGIQDERHRD